MNNDSLQDFALLTTGTLNLLLPQSKITDVAHIEDRQVAELEAITSANSLRDSIKSESRGFISLSDHLTLLPALSRNTFVQTIWSVAPTIHWCWSEVKWLNQVKLAIQPIPAIFHTKDLPVQGITTLNDGTIAFICDSDSLLQFVIKGGEA